MLNLQLKLEAIDKKKERDRMASLLTDKLTFRSFYFPKRYAVNCASIRSS